MRFLSGWLIILWGVRVFIYDIRINEPNIIILSLSKFCHLISAYMKIVNIYIVNIVENNHTYRQ